MLLVAALLVHCQNDVQGRFRCNRGSFQLFTFSCELNLPKYNIGMPVSYETEIIGDGNHASILIPEWVLLKLKTNKRAPLKITVNGHTYQSTAVGVGGECRVVFPSAERRAANAKAGQIVKVTLNLDSGYREVEMPLELVKALKASGLTKDFANLSYSKRKEHARQITEAKGEDTRSRRIEKVIEAVRQARASK